ncbi:ATP-binding cassette domain-containing protein [Aquimarina mytili]|uniref:ATP-binding cassette domain-containing protein n=1 Tax=Aquimarina mytili TaxID=874423 RepID=A0A936ZWK6_9FLAO|nr:ATP-binding cassette domain-containing protein [Aquimarina mytili]MBL0683571.1 ATP-binding cassette domain-containing protein [Aquimarina mytili]
MIHITLQKELIAAHGTMLLDINIDIQRGSLVTLYGDSGAGKTSILRMISGLLAPDKGSITVNQKTWLDTEKRIHQKPQHRKVGYVFQDYGLFPNMTVKENLLYALEKGQSKNTVTELIDTIELGDLQDRKPEKLSGGQKQRVALARALVRTPEILMLDEPLSALDNTMRAKLQDYILKVHKQYNLTTILISHEISEVIKMSDQVFVIENGKIKKQGSPIEVFTTKQMSGKFQFSGEVVHIEKEDVIYIVTILIGTNFVKIVAEETEIGTIAIGDKVIVASKAFNPLLQKVH